MRSRWDISNQSLGLWLISPIGWIWAAICLGEAYGNDLLPAFDLFNYLAEGVCGVIWGVATIVGGWIAR